ncbi:MAG TPA: ACT domain-containing protein [Candidatus Bathyarchaeia archaeon]|nr:ACT domain-containing protein [Candidatus Bathyarchaeia archaeon]
MPARQRRRLIIAKFGGSSLSSGNKITLAADSVAREYSKGNRLVVVVSAVGRTTDDLLELTNHGAGIVETDRDDILAMGERTSAKIFAASLKARGIQARHFDPADRDWPIITDHDFSNANPLKTASVQRIRKHVKPLLEDGLIPVIGGFIGRTRDGRITTLGRGGSDTTALLLATALEADEIVLVTSAPGILTGDPNLISNPHVLRTIEMKALVGIADSGTKFIHRKALRYKDPAINIRVIPSTAGRLDAQGTRITSGPLPELEVKIHNPDPIASITLVGRDLPQNPDLIRKVTKIIRMNLVAISQDGDSAILYLSQTPSLRRQISKLHDVVASDPRGLALAARMGLALITVKGVGLEETPGVVARITDALRSSNINIFGVLTITSSVLVLVDWKERKRAGKLIKTSLENN